MPSGLIGESLNIESIPAILLSLLAVFSIALISCRHGFSKDQQATPIPANSEADRTPATFLENCKQLKESSGFRQNIWLCFNQDAHGAICMDLNRQLYLVVASTLPARPDTQFKESYQKLQISDATLLSRMDPESFVLANRGNSKSLGIFQIPADADESFAVDLFNHLFNLTLAHGDLSFQWD